MAKFLREKKVVVLLNGRHAGKKAVIVKNTLSFHVHLVGGAGVPLMDGSCPFGKWSVVRRSGTRLLLSLSPFYPPLSMYLN